jgi:protein-S-isoprenylcysteine O-methyltransferase Ste14
MIRHLRALLALPIMATIMIPGLLIITLPRTQPGWAANQPLRSLMIVSGLILVAVGLLLVYQTVRLFSRVGDGTLAPWDPPRQLVVRGIYHHVRNPMISGVMAILAGESLILSSLPVAVWWLFFVIGNMVYIPLLEEPALRRRFGEDYRRYAQAVPRWVPRLQPYEPDEAP